MATFIGQLPEAKLTLDRFDRRPRDEFELPDQAYERTAATVERWCGAALELAVEQLQVRRDRGRRFWTQSTALRLADLELQDTGRPAYTRAVEILKKAARAAKADDRDGEFTEHVATLRDRHRRRPMFISLLDKAGIA